MYNVTLLSNGMLFSRALDFGEKKDTTIGLVFDYDFIWHSFMELTSLSPGAAIKQRIRFDNGSKIEWQFHLDALLLGTTDYYYLRREKIALPEGTYRDYNFTTGGETVFKWKYVSKNGFILNTDFHGYAMYVFSDSFQDFDGQYTGWELIGIETVDFEVPVSSKVNVGFSNQVYLKKTFYSDIPKIFSTVYTASVFAKLKLK